MAKARRTSTSRQRKQAAEIRHLLVFDALRSGIVPTIATGLVLTVWMLLSMDLIASRLALSVAAALVLFITLHSGLSPFLSEGTTLGVAGAVIAFSCAWALIIFWPLHHTIYGPPPVFAGEINAGEPVTVPLHGEPGHYRITIKGYFPPSAAQANRGAHYRLHVVDGAGLDRILEGEFTDAWRQQRLGRRGRFPVHVVSDLSQQKIESTSGRDFTLTVTDTSGSMRNVVRVEIAAVGFALPLFAALGVVLTGAALVIDTWRPVVPRTGIVTMETLAALFGGVTFSQVAGWRPGFGALGVSALAGTVVGVSAGAILWRLLRAPAQHLFARDV